MKSQPVHLELGQGQGVAETQPPGPVLSSLVTYQGPENSVGYLDLGQDTGSAVRATPPFPLGFMSSHLLSFQEQENRTNMSHAEGRVSGWQ